MWILKNERVVLHTRGVMKLRATFTCAFVVRVVCTHYWTAGGEQVIIVLQMCVKTKMLVDKPVRQFLSSSGLVLLQKV